MGRTKTFENLETRILDNPNSKEVSGRRKKTEKTTEQKEEEEEEEEVRTEQTEKTTWT